MKMQTRFADMEYSARQKPTRREKFLTDLDRLVPWSALVGLIEPHYYRGERGRPPVELELMLRMYLCQNCLGLSDEGIEDAIVDSIAVRRFVGIDLIERQPPDATTLLKFRRLLERVGLPASIFALIREHLGQAEHAKASIRAKVEHVFHVVKDLFRHRKCRYKGLAKNTAQLQVLFAMANLVLSQRALRAPYRTVAS